MSRLPRRKKLLFALVATGLFFALAEVAARVAEIWLPPQPVDYGLGFDEGSRVFVPLAGDATTLATDIRKTVCFRFQKFPAHKPPRTLRIVALGESSVNYLDGALAAMAGRLQARHAQRFDRVEIVNCGGESYGSHRLAPVLKEVLDYQPDLVLIYLGHNEFEEVEQLQLATGATAEVERSLSHSALIRFLRDRINAARAAHLRAEHNRALWDRTRPDVGQAWRYPFTPEDLQTRMAAFRENLGTMLRLCRERGVPVVLGTVPSNLVAPHANMRQRYLPVAKLLQEERYAEAAELGRQIIAEAPGRHQSSDQENDIIRDLVAEYGLPLADVERAVIAAEPHGLPGETLFEDHCHLNAAGRAVWIKTYEPLVEDWLGGDNPPGGR